MKKIFLILVAAFLIWLLFIPSPTKNYLSDENLSFDFGNLTNDKQLSFKNGWQMLETGAPRTSGQLPLMIFCHEVKDEYGPTYCYERVDNIASSRVDNKNQKMAMCLSLSECNIALSLSDVKIIGYNPESGHTPAEEMRSLFFKDESNVICKFSKTATKAGMIPIVGPIRDNVRRLPAEFLVKNCGLRGIAVQEQKYIEDPSSTALGRYNAVIRDVTPYLNAGKEMGVQIQVHVQIMEERCPDLDKCRELVRLLTDDSRIWSLAIWPSNTGISPAFVLKMRSR